MVPVALDHMMQFGIGKTPSEADAKDFYDLVRFKNLYLKFSPVNYGGQAVLPGYVEMFKQIVDRFGARRMMWGSNYSATHDHPYKKLVDIGRQMVSFLPKDDQKWLLARLLKPLACAAEIGGSAFIRRT